MRIYISADIEGIAGVVSRDNLMPGRFEYEQARDWMTDAVLAACETVHELGAAEVVVSDSHGNGQNIRFERMPSYVQLVRSWPRPLGMMQGIEVGDYAGTLLIGYHAGATNMGGTLSHTISGEFFHEIRLNGVTASEAGISAAIAGHFGVPVLMIAGDDVAVAETRALLGDIASAQLKTSLGFLSAMMLSPEAADARLREAVREAIGRIGTISPYVFAPPVALEIRLRTRFMAEWLGYIDEVEQLDAFTIRYPARDMVAASRFLQFITSARGALG
jgi:D-amino peptidase